MRPNPYAQVYYVSTTTPQAMTQWITPSTSAMCNPYTATATTQVTTIGALQQQQASMQSLMTQLSNAQSRLNGIPSWVQFDPYQQGDRWTPDKPYLKLGEQWVGAIELFDGFKIVGELGPAGHVIRLEDKDAKVRYRAATHDFNRYLNASDLLEEFIRYVGRLGVRQGEVLKLPIDLFIGFLMIRAAESDGEEPPPVVLALPTRQSMRCVGCGRFIIRRPGVTACNGAHLDHHLARIAA